MTKFLPDFIQWQQEAFKGCSLWLSFPSGQSVVLNLLVLDVFSLVQSFLAVFLLRLSGSRAQKSGSPKENSDFGCFVFVLDFDSKHLQEAWGKIMFCVVTASSSPWTLELLLLGLEFYSSSMNPRICNSWKSILLQLLKARDQALKGYESIFSMCPQQ